MFTVLKPFSTPNRFFAAGRIIVEAELEGPIALADWQAAGFISVTVAPGVAPVAAPDAPNPAPNATPDAEAQALADAKAELALAEAHLAAASAASS